MKINSRTCTVIREIRVPASIFYKVTLAKYRNRLGARSFFNETSQIAERCSAYTQAVTRQKNQMMGGQIQMRPMKTVQGIAYVYNERIFAMPWTVFIGRICTSLDD